MLKERERGKRDEYYLGTKNTAGALLGERNDEALDRTEEEGTCNDMTAVVAVAIEPFMEVVIRFL